MQLVSLFGRSRSFARGLSIAAAAVAESRGAAAAAAVRAEHGRFFDRREVDFVLTEVEGIEGDHGAVLDSCEAFVEEFHHLDPILDRNPPWLVTTSDGHNAVATPPECKRLVAAYRERGFAELAELGLPFSVQCASLFTLHSAFSSNWVGMFILTRCAADLLAAHGDERLKAEYLPRLRSAEWMGTMALSEPQAGSSLATIRTQASPVDDGAVLQPGCEVRLRGDKMWTTAAFHDCADNVIHMVLARLPGAPAGSAGISLFLVPAVRRDGSRNALELISLNKKMGHRGVSNCAWALEDATGYLVGAPHQGLRCMLHMMNAMRIEVGLGAACVGKRALQESLLYAQERVQGGRPIVEHADVRRMLLLQKAYAEGSHALCIHAAALHDRAAAGEARAATLLELLTEVVKSWPSEWCLEGNRLAMQVLGGSGYVQDYPLEQLYRDQRLNPIHEGTTGIHALTLLARKVRDGRAAPLFDEMRATADDAATLGAEAGMVGSCAVQLGGGAAGAQHAATTLAECSAALRAAVERAEEVTAMLTHPTLDRSAALANAHEYLSLFGHTVAAWTWLRVATAAARGLERERARGRGESDAAILFYEGKLHTCRFFFRHELPKTEAWARLLMSLDDTVSEMRPGWF